ncbi:MAG: hypothetical protein AAF806_08210 [Bacteroidota bacterium]
MEASFGLQISRIILSGEKEESNEIDYVNTCTDVIVELENGDTFIASFLTFHHLFTIIQSNIENGNFLNGKYFWMELMVLVKDCSIATIEAVIEDMIEEGDFLLAFQRL